MIFKLRLNPRILSLRIAVFNIIFVDYLGICFRTLGQGLFMTYQSSWDLVGYTTALLLVSCMLLELVFIFKKTNKIYIKKETELESKEKVIWQVFFGGLDKKTIKRVRMVRNYEILQLVRYLGMVLFIFNLQYLQLLQVVFPLVLVVGFSTITYYHQLADGIFESRLESIFKLIQEASMSIMMLVVSIFCWNSFEHILSRTAKKILAYIFIGLLVCNIALEIVSSAGTLIKFIVDLISWCRKKLIKKKEKKKRNRVKSELAATSGRNMNGSSTRLSLSSRREVLPPRRRRKLTFQEFRKLKMLQRQNRSQLWVQSLRKLNQ